jgi:hypothetical protein
MALRLNDGLRNYIVDKGVIQALGAGTAALKVYTGTQPGTAGFTSGTCRLIVTISSLDWTAGTGGTGTLKVGPFTGTASTDGTAGWARLYDGTTGTAYIIDGGCGTANSNQFVIDNDIISKDAVVTLTSATIIMPGS